MEQSVHFSSCVDLFRRVEHALPLNMPGSDESFQTKLQFLAEIIEMAFKGH